MSTRTIQEIVSGRTLVVASPDMTVRSACCLMTEKHIGALLVVQDGAIAGIFTERDVLNKIVSAGRDPETTCLHEVMVRDPQTIGGDKPLGYALYMMAEGGFRHVPVVDGAGKPIGMVSARDALGQDMLDLERELKNQEALESSIGY